MAPTTAPVLIGGETGTGKELLARRVHARSGRSGPFIAVNCATIPDQLAESILFGHKRGAFTGATEASAGLVRSAHKGTLFLDEIGDLPLATQTRLLRVLQQRAVAPVGEATEVPVDLRVVAATHRDLRDMVRQGTFREDLYFRLAVFPVALPPLRERGRDVVTLARSLLGAGVLSAPPRALSRAAEAVLCAHPWPGNVRELECVLFRAALRATSGAVSAGHLREELAGPEAVAAPATARVLALLRAGEPLASSEVAETVGLSRATAQRVLRAMVEAGDLVAVGTGRATRYRPPSAEDRSDPREWAALEIVAREGRVTRAGLAHAVGCSPRTALRVLGELVAKGELVAEGMGNTAGYRARLTKTLPPDTP